MDYYFVFDELKTGQNAMCNIILVQNIILVIFTNICQYLHC